MASIEAIIKRTGAKKFSEQEIKKIVENDVYQTLLREGETIFNRVNKRIINIERNNKIISPAYEALKNKRGNAPRFGTMGTYKNLKELAKEIERARAFDNMETSTVQGARNYTNKLLTELNRKSVKELSPDFISEIFEALHMLHERMPDELYKNQLQYASYLDTIIETAENTDLQALSSAERVETVVTDAIDKLTRTITRTLNTSFEDFEKNISTRLY